MIALLILTALGGLSLAFFYVAFVAHHHFLEDKVLAVRAVLGLAGTIFLVMFAFSVYASFWLEPRSTPPTETYHPDP